MLSKEFLLSLFDKQLKEKLDSLEEKNTKETSCLLLLSTNMKSIESNF